MDSRSIEKSPTPSKIELFLCKATVHERAMTVIQGIPFYRSTGINSGQKDTWFPHRGLSRHNNWIMKPQAASLPQDVLNFCENLKIEEEVKLKRFGTLQAMCISASIGTGFWQTNSGIKLKEFLYTNYYKNYPHFFLNDEVVTKLLDEQENIPVEVKKTSRVNKQLAKLGSIVILDYENSRLPSTSEINFFRPGEDHEKVNSILTSMLTLTNHISEATYQSIIKLCQNEDCRDYLVENYVFEDPLQVQALNLLMAQTDNITPDDLKSIDQLYHPTISEDEYEDLLEYPEARCVLRLLNRNNIFSLENIDVIFELLDEDILLENMYLLANPDALAALVIINQKSWLDQDAVNLVETLVDSGQIKKYTNLLKHEVAYLSLFALEDQIDVSTLEFLCKLFNTDMFDKSTIVIFENIFGVSALKILDSQDLLNEETVILLVELARKSLLGRSIDLLQSEIALEALRALAEDGALNKRNLKILNYLFTSNLLTGNLDLLANQFTREALISLIEKEALNADLIAVIKELHKQGLLEDILENVGDLLSSIESYRESQLLGLPGQESIPLRSLDFGKNQKISDKNIFSNQTKKDETEVKPTKDDDEFKPGPSNPTK